MEIFEGSMQGKHSVITYTLTVQNQEIATHALIDCGATGIALMDNNFARNHQIPLQELLEKHKSRSLTGDPFSHGILRILPKLAGRYRIMENSYQCLL